MKVLSERLKRNQDKILETDKPESKNGLKLGLKMILIIFMIGLSTYIAGIGSSLTYPSLEET